MCRRRASTKRGLYGCVRAGALRRGRRGGRGVSGATAATSATSDVRRPSTETRDLHLCTLAVAAAARPRVYV